MLSTTSIPVSISSSFEFLDYIKEIDPRHKVPRRTAAMREIHKLYLEGKKIVKAGLKASTSNITLTADIWTKPGFSSSYLGITVHFISSGDRPKLESVVIELAQFPTPHTGTAIAKKIVDVLDEWGIMD